MDGRPMIRIERTAGPLDEWIAPLVEESEREGRSLVRRLRDEWASGVNRFDRPGEVLFVARTDALAVGVGGLSIDPYANASGIGRVRHLYVRAAYRRAGIGELLMHAIMDAARGSFDVLRLRTNNPAAARLYERLGFERVDETDCSHTLAPRALA